MNREILFFVFFLVYLWPSEEQNPNLDHFMGRNISKPNCTLICCVPAGSKKKCCTIIESFENINNHVSSARKYFCRSSSLSRNKTCSRRYGSGFNKNVCPILPSTSTPQSNQGSYKETKTTRSVSSVASQPPQTSSHLSLSYKFTDSNPDSIGPHLYKISRMLNLLEQGCAPVSDCRSSIVSKISQIEVELREITFTEGNFTEKSTEEGKFKLKVARRGCEHETEASIGAFSLLYRTSVTNCSSYLIALSQLQIPASAGKHLNTDEAKAPQLGEVEFVMVPERLPYLSVVAFEEETFNTLRGNLSFTWKGDYQVILRDQVLPLNNLNGGRVVAKRLGAKCSFIDTKLKRFSNQGCRTEDSIPAGLVKCSCSHTTVFVILLSFRVVIIPLGVEICSYVTESLSVIFLLITSFTLLRYKEEIRSNRTIIQLNLSISLLLLHTTSLFHGLLLLSEYGCVAGAVFTHFFLLTSGFWMSVEGMHLYIGTSPHVLRYGPWHIGKRRAVHFLFAWGIPLCIVIIAALVGWNLGIYMKVSPVYQALISSSHSETTSLSPRKYDICWMDQQTPLYFASVTAPIAVVLLFNLGITLKVFSVVVHMNKYSPTKRKHNKKRIYQIKSTLKTLFILIFVLGLPWALAYLIGFLHGEASVFIIYINAILNGLQGVFIFILYCLLNPTLKARIESTRSVSSGIKW